MTLTPQELDDLCTEKSIKSALKVCKKVKALGKHPLAKLKIVEIQRRTSSYGDNPDGYGLALRNVLDKAIERLKPTEQEPPKLDILTKPWRPYFILTQLVEGRSQKYIRDHLVIAPRTYRREQSEAFDRLANVLREQEQLANVQKEEAVTARHVPFMAPSLPSYALVGRDQMLANLKRRLFAGDMQDLALFALEGLPGVGKSALATTLAHDAQVRSHFEDGVLWAGLGRQPDVLALLSSWGIALGISGSEMGKLTTIKDRARAIKAAIGTRRMLLVVDDAWQIKDALAFKLGGPNCAHLLTTRLRDLAWDFAEQGARAVQELNHSDSLALLSEIVPELVIKYPKEAKELVKTVGGLPLALILMGRYLQKSRHFDQQNPLTNLIEQLQNVVRRLKLSMHLSPLEQQPSLPFGARLSLLASIEISDQALKKAARQMLRGVAVFPAKPNDFSEDAALTVADKPIETLEMLIQAGLVESSRDKRYTLHQTIADYARLKKNSDPDPDFYDQRAANYFADFAQELSDSKGYRLLDLDWRNVSHFMEWAYNKQQWKVLLDGVQGLTHHNLGVVGFMDARGHWNNARELLPKALEGAKALNDPLLEASILTKMGAFAFKQAEIERAEGNLKESFSILSPLPSSTEVTWHRTHIYEFMFRLERQRDIQAAQKWVERGVVELDALPVKTNAVEYQTGYFYVLLGMMSGIIGQLPKAIETTQKGLALLPSSATSAKIVALVVLGNVYCLQGNINKSIEYQTEGIQVAQELGDLRKLASLWTNLGINEELRGNLTATISSYQKALQVYQDIGDIGAEGTTHNNLALTYIVLGNDEQALSNLTLVLTVSVARQECLP